VFNISVINFTSPKTQEKCGFRYGFKKEFYIYYTHKHIYIYIYMDISNIEAGNVAGA